jgi:hypothetical protein
MKSLVFLVFFILCFSCLQISAKRCSNSQSSPFPSNVVKPSDVQISQSPVVQQSGSQVQPSKSPSQVQPSKSPSQNPGSPSSSTVIKPSNSKSGVPPPPTTNKGLSISGMDILNNGVPTKIWGVRVGSASQTQSLTDKLISNLDSYKSYGVNTMAVYYMGTSGAYSDPFSSDGKTIDAGHQSRMQQIIEACAARNMFVIVGIFYQRSDSVHLKDWNAAVQAVATVTDLLKKKGYTNVIINIANEQNSGTYGSLPWAGVNDPNKIFQMIQAAKLVDPTRIIGAGGYDHSKNVIIGKNSVVDVLLFDTNGPEVSKDLFYQFKNGGVNKPMINVETFGGWTKEFLPPGVFPQYVKDTYIREVDGAIQTKGLSVCLHNNPWYQGPSVGSYPIRFDLGGMGTSSDPGLKWYFTYVRDHKTD